MTTTDPAFANCRLMVATPIYDGAQGSYVRSALDFALNAREHGLPVRFEFVLNQAHIDRARSLLAGMFMASDCTHLLFVDADIGFTADEVFSMLSAMDADPDCAVLGVACPRRIINWRNVMRAVERGVGKGEPADLARFAGDFALKFLESGKKFALTDLIELEWVGTAMMLIRRDVFEGLRDKHPELAFRPGPLERRDLRLGEMTHAFFFPMIEPETQLLLSEDYAFCRRARDAGFRIWLAPWVRTTHSGPTLFRSSLADVAQLLSPTSASSPE